MFRSTTSHFPDTRLLNDAERPQNYLHYLTHLTSQVSYNYTLNTHLQGPNITPFRSMTIRFRDTRLSKIGKAPNDPRMTLSN